MFLETVHSPGLAHLSYVVGDGHRAAVIDPRLDVSTYLEIAEAHGARIELVFETHRNEDLVSGARALAQATGARVLHGTDLDFAHGEGAEDGMEQQLGKLRLRVLHTPGHTDESLSIAIYDEEFGNEAVGVFTGDALFIGDVGRTDFYPDRAREVAGALYDSIFEKLLPLGDQALVYPAHGAGSVCGGGMASRDFSSIGHERMNNPALQLSRPEFIAKKANEHHYQPPYFREMERVNKEGAERVLPWPRPRLVTAPELARALEDDLVLVDVRSPEAFAGCSIPGSIALPVDLIASYAGWFLPYDRPLGLVAESDPEAREAVRRLARMGYTRVESRLAGGVRTWETSGRDLQSIPAVSAATLRRKLAEGETFSLVDVRNASEYAEGHLPGSYHSYLGELPEDGRLRELEPPLVTFCGSGRRALVAASLLHRAGIHDVQVCFGSMQACRAVGCPIEQETRP